MNKRVSLACGLAVGLMMSPTASLGGAWTLPTGDGIGIVTGTFARSDLGFDGSRSVQPIPRYNKDELQALLEYGFTDWFTAILIPSLQHIDVAQPFPGQRTGFGYTEFGGRVRLWTNDQWVISGQTTYRVPGTYDRNNPAAIGYYDPELEIRGLVGYSYKLGSWPAFINTEVAERFRFAGPPDEFRTDITFGVRPLERWLLLAQSFNVTSEGSGTWGIPSYDYYKLQLSAVYEVTPTFSVQLGGYTTYEGRNALQENGLIVGAWYKF